MPIQQRFLFRKLLPIVAVAAFITMVAIGEKQVRSSRLDMNWADGKLNILRS
jgi:hypothetical protein